jgi:hypothetical protein
MTGFTILRPVYRGSAKSRFLKAQEADSGNEIINDDGDMHVDEALSPTQSEVTPCCAEA